MAEHSESTVVEELENRLDLFFDEDEESSDFKDRREEPKRGYFKELKAILLSIDWEITDEIMAHFVDVLSKMKQAFRGDKNVHVFLQMIGSMAKYLKLNKAKAHPGVIEVLNAVYSAMEKVNLDTGITEKEKERILLREVRRFKNLKNEIAGSRVKRKHGSGDETPEENHDSPKKEKRDHRPGMSGLSAEDETKEGYEDTARGPATRPEAFAYALEEIKALIRAEFRALRADLRRGMERGQRQPS